MPRSVSTASRCSPSSAVRETHTCGIGPRNGRRCQGMGKVKTLGIGAAIAGAAAYAARRISRRAGHAVGMRSDVDDVTLTQKVESELYREAGAPKGRISVNAADGVVQLRGEVDG